MPNTFIPTALDYAHIRNGPGVSVLSFGADPTGTRDNASAFTQAIAAVIDSSHRGGTLIVPPGTYLLNSTVVIPSAMGFRLEGAGGSTVFTWGGNNSTPMFSLQSNLDSYIGNFTILCNSATQNAGTAPFIQMTTANNTNTGVTTFGVPVTGQELRVRINDTHTTFVNSATLIFPTGYAGTTVVGQVYVFYGFGGQYWMTNPF